jgi:hypothetical protein
VVSRPIHHHAYVARSFDDVCDEIEVRGAELVAVASETAAAFAADLAGYLEQQLGFFDRDERVVVVVDALERDAAEARLPVRWRADEKRRLLPNVEAAIHLTPIISRGAAATTEVSLQGSFTPPRARHRGIVEHALVRRVVDATLHTFLRHLADALDPDRARLERQSDTHPSEPSIDKEIR